MPELDGLAVVAAVTHDELPLYVLLLKARPRIRRRSTALTPGRQAT